MEKIRIRDKHPGSATLLNLVTITDVDSDPESFYDRIRTIKKTRIMLSITTVSATMPTTFITDLLIFKAELFHGFRPSLRIRIDN
jgi:hypothetical protein